MIDRANDPGDGPAPAPPAGWDECSRSRALAAELAAKGLTRSEGRSATPGSDQPIGGDVAIGLPAARLLLRDDPAEYPKLVDGFRTLAAMGRSFVTAVTDPSLASASSPVRGIGDVPALRDGAGH